MAKPDKAQITYKVGEGDDTTESTLRFHSVIAEDHSISTEITKFPVQSGFSISNHAIKKNRVVTITGVISNHLVIGAVEFHEYGGNNSRLMFSTLKDLVRGAIPCDVVTNYGNYSPVIFTKFKTKLQSGKTDIMEFTITGEEVQLASTVNGTTPNLLVFTPLTETERKARVEELIAAGLEVPQEAVITTANVDFNESFQLETIGSNGKKSVMTYEKTSYDPTLKVYSHNVHTSDTEVAKSEGGTAINWFQIMQEEAEVLALPNLDLSAGASTASACLKDELTKLAAEEADDFIETSLGNLKKSVYGAVYGAFGVNGDQSFGQVLLSIGLDCFVAGAVGSVDSSLNPDDFNETTLPTVDEALGGATNIGNTIFSDTLTVSAPSTITKISLPETNTNFFGDLI